MTLDEVIQFTKQALENVNPDKRVYAEFRYTVKQVKQLLEWLEEYNKIKEYWLPSDEEELRKERGECNNLYEKIDSVVSGLYSAIADQILEKIRIASKYKRLEADYVDLDNRLRTANTENEELKRLLGLAIESMQVMSRADGCVSCSQCRYETPIGEDENGDYINSPHCDKSDCFEWEHYDEAIKLLGGTDNAEN